MRISDWSSDVCCSDLALTCRREMRGMMLEAHELAAGLHRSHAGRSRSHEGVANAARRQIADDLVHHCVRLDGRMAKGPPAADRRNDMPPLVGQLALRVIDRKSTRLNSSH